MRDELALEIHLASMELRDRWHALQPRLREVEHAFTHAGKRVGAAIDQEVAVLGAALQRLRDDLPSDRS